eukprot:c20987_g1_i2 orf=141-674(+)
MDGTRSMGSRSSSRHGPASSALFTGPVRRWKKAWAPISPPTASSTSSSKVFLYKWVPLPPGTKDETSEEPTIQTVRYLPVSIALAQRKDASRRALEDVEASLEEKPSENLVSELAAQSEASGLQIDHATLEGSSACPDSEDQGLEAEKQVVRDLNFSEGAEMSVDVEMQVEGGIAVA